MNQDLPELSGGEQVLTAARGRTFDLWVNCVRTNERLPATRKLLPEFAQKIQDAARAAAQAAGALEDDIAAREFIALYPEAFDPDLRAASRAGVKAYCRIGPDRANCQRWSQMVAVWDAQAGKDKFRKRWEHVNLAKMKSKELLDLSVEAEQVLGLGDELAGRCRNILEQRRVAQADRVKIMGAKEAAEPVTQNSKLKTQNSPAAPEPKHGDVETLTKEQKSRAREAMARKRAAQSEPLPPLPKDAVVETDDGGNDAPPEA